MCTTESNIIWFYGPEHVCSNMYPCKIQDPYFNMEFNCVSQGYVYYKSISQKYPSIGCRVMHESNPWEIEKLNSMIVSDYHWRHVERTNIMKYLLNLKFAQVAPYREFLFHNLKNLDRLRSASLQHYWGGAFDFSHNKLAKLHKETIINALKTHHENVLTQSMQNMCL